MLINSATKKPSAHESNQALDLVSIENLPKTNDGPMSATSPRFRIKEDHGAKSKTTRAPEYYSSLGGMSKEQLNTEESPVTTTKDTRIESESRPTTTSNRDTSATGGSDNKWDGVV